MCKWIILLTLLAAASVSASDYLIGPGDELEISFWQDPRFDATLRVRQDGMITVDIIGEIEAAGKTTLQLQDAIVRRMSRLNKSITQAVVRVGEYNYQHVFVTGHVNTPGKISFESIPDLVTVIQEAGWITDQGDLSRVTIIRGGAAAGEVETVNLSAAIASGQVADLPQLHRQDAVEVPMMPVGMPTRDLGRDTPLRNVVYVTGAVTTPGVVIFDDNIDVYEAIAMAGGPTESADLKKVSVITKDGYYGQSLGLDLEAYASMGSPTRYIVRQEDHVVVPFRHSSFLGGTIGTAATVLGVATSFVLLYQSLRSDDNPDGQ